MAAEVDEDEVEVAEEEGEVMGSVELSLAFFICSFV